MRGIVNLYKPKGVTSNYCVGAVRRALGTRAVGHMGTLDPQGEGVLPIGVGKCTRLFDFYLHKDKVYEADFTFGYTTDTLDGDGRTTADGGRIPTETEIRDALDGQVGTRAQIPPLYSAKSVDGVRAYELARRGIPFELKPKSVEIFAARLLTYDPPTARVTVHCSAGTYIRSICRDVAEALGTLATMTSIKRIRSGPFRIEDAITIDRLDELGERALIPAERALADVRRFDADGAFYEKLANGVRTDVGAPEGQCALYCKSELFGLAQTEAGITRITTYLR